MNVTDGTMPSGDVVAGHGYMIKRDINFLNHPTKEWGEF